MYGSNPCSQSSSTPASRPRMPTVPDSRKPFRAPTDPWGTQVAFVGQDPLYDNFGGCSQQDMTAPFPTGRSINPFSYSWKGDLYCVPLCGGVVPTRDPDAYPHAAWFPLSGVRSTTRAGVVEGNETFHRAAPRLSNPSGADTFAAVPSPCPTITSRGSLSCFGDVAAGNPGASGAAGASTGPARDSWGAWSTIAYSQRGYSDAGLARWDSSCITQGTGRKVQARSVADGGRGQHGGQIEDNCPGAGSARLKGDGASFFSGTYHLETMHPVEHQDNLCGEPGCGRFADVTRVTREGRMERFCFMHESRDATYVARAKATSQDHKRLGTSTVLEGKALTTSRDGTASRGSAGVSNGKEENPAIQPRPSSPSSTELETTSTSRRTAPLPDSGARDTDSPMRLLPATSRGGGKEVGADAMIAARGSGRGRRGRQLRPGRLDGEVPRIVRKLCEIPGCKVQPSYGPAGTKRPRFCTGHKQPGMVALKNRPCLSLGCDTRPHYGFSGGRAVFCVQHMEPGMVHILKEQMNEKSKVSKRPGPRKERTAPKKRIKEDVIKAQDRGLARVEGTGEVVCTATGRLAKAVGEEDEGNDAQEAPGRRAGRQVERTRGRDRQEDDERELKGIGRGVKRRRDTVGEMQHRGDGADAGGTDGEDGRHREDTPGAEVGPHRDRRKGSESDDHTGDRGVDNEGEEGRRSPREDRKHEDYSSADGTVAGPMNAGGKESRTIGGGDGGDGGESGGGYPRPEDRPYSPALSCTSSSAPSWKDSGLGTALGTEGGEGVSSPLSAASSIEDAGLPKTRSSRMTETSGGAPCAETRLLQAGAVESTRSAADADGPSRRVRVPSLRALEAAGLAEEEGAQWMSKERKEAETRRLKEYKEQHKAEGAAELGTGHEVELVTIKFDEVGLGCDGGGRVVGRKEGARSVASKEAWRKLGLDENRRQARRARSQLEKIQEEVGTPGAVSMARAAASQDAVDSGRCATVAGGECVAEPGAGERRDSLVSGRGRNNPTGGGSSGDEYACAESEGEVAIAQRMSGGAAACASSITKRRRKEDGVMDEGSRDDGGDEDDGFKEGDRDKERDKGEEEEDAQGVSTGEQDTNRELGGCGRDQGHGGDTAQSGGSPAKSERGCNSRTKVTRGSKAKRKRRSRGRATEALDEEECETPEDPVMCEFATCERRATFGVNGAVRYCKAHRLFGMLDITKRR